MKRLRSSVWLEHRPFKPGVAGSNPVGAILKTENVLNQLNFIILEKEIPSE